MFAGRNEGKTMRVDTSMGLDLDPRDVAIRAEEARLDGIWAGEVKHDPLLALTLAATVTEQIELGTSITLAFARNPMSLAVQANDIQALSQGRLILGLGSQVKAHITRRFGMPWSRPADRMKEYIQALHAIWACFEQGEPLEFDGEFYTHTLMTPFFQPDPHGFGRPQILLAAVGPAMTKVAGEVADGVLLHGFTTEKYLREVTVPALATPHAGVLPSGYQVSGMPFVVTGSGEEQMDNAAAAVRSQIAFYASTPAYFPVLETHGWLELGERLHAMSRTGGWDTMGELIDDEVLEAFAVVAEPDDVAAALVARYGDVMTRIRLYLPYPAEADVVSSIQQQLKIL